MTMPRIQLIIEADSANQLAHVIRQMAHSYRKEATGESHEPNVAAATAAKNGADEPADYVAPEAEAAFPVEIPEDKADVPAPKVKRGRKAAAPAEPAQPEAGEEAAPAEIPPLDDLKQAITKAVVAEPHGGPIRTALETLRPTLKINLIRNASEEHRAALFTFVQQHQIPVGPDQV